VALKHADVVPSAPEHTEAVDVTAQCAGVSKSVEDHNAEIHRLLDESMERASFSSPALSPVDKEHVSPAAAPPLTPKK
jgi:hypothetical protein